VSLDVTGMTAAIEAAFATEWAKSKPNMALPAAGQEDRRMLFAAVARGILEYLKDHEDEIFKTITIEEGAGRRVHKIVEADLDFSRSA